LVAKRRRRRRRRRQLAPAPNVGRREEYGNEEERSRPLVQSLEGAKKEDHTCHVYVGK
jgi:hypothetical protein